MMKFFRKIRQILLSEGKSGKYFKYAFGEIILVVVGILIALSLNNWNEIQKEKIEREKILLGIKNDFLETRKGLWFTINNQERAIHYSQRLINLLEIEQSQYNSDSINTYLNFGATDYYRAEPVIGTYDALIGSGNTSILQNQKLLTSLAKFSAIAKLPFEDEIFSMNLIKLIQESTAEYGAVLMSNEARKQVKATFRYTEEDKQAAIKKLTNNKPFLLYLLSRTPIEMNRLHRQNSLLKNTKEILTALGVKGLVLNAEDVLKYVGNYEHVDGSKKKFKISAKENQLSVGFKNDKFKMMPNEQNSFVVPGLGLDVMIFDVENNSVKYVTVFTGGKKNKYKKSSTFLHATLCTQDRYQTCHCALKNRI